MSPSNQIQKRPPKPCIRFKKLNPDQITKIEELLVSVGEYGEVRLIVQRGELRYINKVESYNAREMDVRTLQIDKD